MKNKLLALAFLVPLTAIVTTGVMTLRTPAAHASCGVDAGSCTNANFSGDYSFHVNIPGYLAVLGVMHADGNGNLSGHEKVTTSNSPSMTIQEMCLSGTYTIGADGYGTGTMDVYADPGCAGVPDVTMHIDIVLEDGGDGFRAMNLDGETAILSTGRRQ